MLALQGSVEEHIDVLHKLGAATREIRVKEEVAGVDGLIFPGGESTAMAIMTEGDPSHWLISTGDHDGRRRFRLRETPFQVECRPTARAPASSCWRTTASARRRAARHWSAASTARSAATTLARKSRPSSCPSRAFPDAAPAVFIRAPAILKRGPTCEALASVTSAPSRDAAPHVEAFEPAKKKRKGSSSGEREVARRRAPGPHPRDVVPPRADVGLALARRVPGHGARAKKEGQHPCPSRVSARPIQDACRSRRCRSDAREVASMLIRWRTASPPRGRGTDRGTPPPRPTQKLVSSTS